MMKKKYSTSWLIWGIPLIITVIIGGFVLSIYALRWYIKRPMYKGTARIDGKTVVITGGNTGIGKETARELMKRGARVILLCRNVMKGRVAAEEIAEPGFSAQVYRLDLASIESIRKCAQTIIEKEEKIDILINNAGVMLAPYTKTKDGFELHFGVNHLGHFLLTYLLLNNIKMAAPSRIINVSSNSHEVSAMNWDDLHMSEDYNSITAYRQSKLANLLFTKSLSEKLKGTGVTVYAVHPGSVATEITRHIESALGRKSRSLFRCIFHFFAKTPKEGAQTSIFCAVDEFIAEETGKYYSGCAEKKPSARATNMEDAERLWDLSLKMTELDAEDVKEFKEDDIRTIEDEEIKEIET